MGSEEAQRVRVGIGLSPDLIRLGRSRLGEMVNQINASAIDHVVVTDHVAFRGGRGQDGLSTLHYLAGLGLERPLHTGVLILPIRHPTLVARQLLDLADVHPFGVVAGVGLGGDDPAEYSMVGMQARGLGSRMDEAVDLLVDLLGEREAIDRDGLYGASGPGLRRGDGERVQVLVGGRVDASHRRAALADGWLAAFCSPSRFGAGGEQVRALSPSATLGYQAWIGVGPDGREQADAQIQRFYGVDPRAFERYVPVGETSTLVEHFQAYVDSGAQVLNLFPAGEPELGISVVATVAEAFE